jgi:hypothetical protein
MLLLGPRPLLPLGKVRPHHVARPHG